MDERREAWTRATLGFSVGQDVMTSGGASTDTMAAALVSHDRWALFAGLWGWALLMHQATFDRWQYSPLGWALVGLAAALVLNPRSLPLLMATVAVNACYAIQCLPGTANHLVFEGFVCFMWLGAFALHAARMWRAGSGLSKPFARDAGAPHPLEGSLAPLRLGLLLVYWISVLHKLNYDFFNPETSCASYMYRRVAEALAFLPEAVWAEHVAIWSTLLAEATLPVLLLHRRTWQLGLVAALSFHLMLGFDPTPGIYSFTCLLYALFVLVLPPSFVQQASEQLRALERRVGRGPLLHVRVIGLLALACALGYGATRTDRFAFHAIFPFFLVWSAVVITGYLAALARVSSPRSAVSSPRSAVSSPRSAVSSPRSAVSPPPRTTLAEVPVPTPALLWVLPCVVLFSGLNPYLGLRTQLSFSMFSNLRTEGGAPNHVFMPRILSLGNYQEDLVEILDTDDADIRDFQDQHLLLPYFEFRRLVSGMENLRVTYLRAGAEHTFECRSGSCNDVQLAEPYSRLMGRLLFFRPVDKGPHMLCRH